MVNLATTVVVSRRTSMAPNHPNSGYPGTTKYTITFLGHWFESGSKDDDWNRNAVF